MSSAFVDYTAKTRATIQDSIAVRNFITCDSSSCLLEFSRLELSRKAGHEPALVGLLRVYKDYYPDIIVGDAAAGRASVFLVGSFLSV